MFMINAYFTGKLTQLHAYVCSLRGVGNTALGVVGPVREEVTGGWWKLYNWGLHNLHFD
jgi:hypothetical protein